MITRRVVDALTEKGHNVASYKTEDELEMERQRLTCQAVSIHQDVTRFKIAHAVTDDEADHASMAVYDTRTNHGIVMNLFPMEGDVEPEALSDESHLPTRFQVEIVLVSPKGERFAMFEDVIHPEK